VSERNLLKRNISNAWSRTLAETYPHQLINSERGLQVHFCHWLLQEFGALERRLFVEPCFRSAEGSTRIPDIVVCNSRRIIGVIELKYMPRAYADYEKDLRTLEWFLSAEPPVELANDRYRGLDERQIKTYDLADDAVLCWAGIYAGPKVDIESNAQRLRLGSQFLGLHAVTAPGAAPTLFTSSSDVADL
jgi:hypothetical protein